MPAYALEYSLWGYRFRVERVVSSTRWCAIGHAAGRHAYALDKLGTEPERDAMQNKLNAWAKANGAKCVNMPQAPEEQMALGI